MIESATYAARREGLTRYFDRTALEAWARLTTDAPVSRIRATVRAGRDAMRATLLGWLPDDLTGVRVLDAGCGTGALAVEAARRGAEVVAIDVSPRLIAIARERAPAKMVDWRVGDMADPALGEFDHVVAMDSLIHYARRDIAAAISALAARTRRTLLFTVAPATPPLMAMFAVGKLLPRADRAPAIQPVAPARLGRDLAALGLAVGRQRRISGGFYTSQAIEVVR